MQLRNFFVKSGTPRIFEIRISILDALSLSERLRKTCSRVSNAKTSEFVVCGGLEGYYNEHFSLFSFDVETAALNSVNLCFLIWVSVDR